MDDQDFLVHVEEVAKLLNEPPVSWEFVAEALRRIRQGKVQVRYYTHSSYPLLRDVLIVARRLQSESRPWGILVRFYYRLRAAR